MALTITIPGAVSTTTGSTAPAILTVGVGSPGVGVPSGGSTGQYLVKASATSYDTAWLTLPANYITSVTAPLAVTAGNLAVDLSAYLTTATAASTYQTIAGMSSYLTSATAASTYAVIAAGQPTSGTVGQVLTKQSGTSYDSAWATLIPGDRYLTSSTTSLSVTNGTKTLTVGTGLSYSSQQDVVIAYDASNHMHAVVTTYNSSTGVMVVNVQNHTGSGTFTAWTVNVGGTVPLQSVAWGEIVGTLGDQTDLATALNDKLELSGGALDVNSTITASTATVNSLFAGDTFGVELTANPSENASLQYNGVQVQNAIGSMLVTASGLTFPNSSTQTVAFPGFTGYAALAGATFTGEVSTPASTTGTAGFSILPGTAPTSPVNGEFWNTGTDLQVRIGGVTETLAEQSWVTSQGYLTSSALTPYAPLAGATFTGLVGTVASTTATAGLNVPHGVATTSPVNGDIWTTTGAVFARINAATKQLMTLSDTQTVSGSITFSNASQTLGSSTATGTINVASGATISASTKTLNIGTGGVVGSTTTTILGPVLGASTTTIGATTAASTLNLATGATLTGTTKAVNIGTGGVAGSTTNIAIGTTSGGTNAITVNGPTTFTSSIAAANNSITLGSGTATSVFNFGNGATLSGSTKAVELGTQGAAGSTTTIAIGGTAGTSTTTLNGTTNGVTAAADTNSVALATTAYVVGQAGSATPLVDGTAAVGTSLRYARQDHVHPTDTSRAALASPTFTGTPTLPTGTIGVTQSPGNNTTAVATTAFVTAAVPAFATTAQVVAATSTSTSLAPGNQGFLLTNPRLQSLGFINSTAVSGSGGSGSTSGSAFSRQVYLGSLAAGRSAYLFGAIGTANAGFGTSTTKADQVDFSKKVLIGGYAMMGYSGSPDYRGDANTICRISLGGYSTNTTGDMTLKGIGLKKVGGVASFVTLTVHNGTTLTDVASTVAIADGAGIQWQIYSDGTGNVTLYINGTQAATTTAGPTTATASGSACYREQVEAVATPAVRGLMSCNGGWFYTE